MEKQLQSEIWRTDDESEREEEVNPKNSTQNDLIERHPHIYIVRVQILRIKKRGPESVVHS